MNYKDNKVNYVISLFGKCLDKIINSDEYDKIIDNTKNGRERHWLEVFRADTIKHKIKYEEIPVWATLMRIESKELLKDLMSFIIMECEVVYDIKNDKIVRNKKEK